jgi:uncharacterized protein
MLRVVADANVLISAALARSPNAPSVLTLDAALDGRLELITSPLLLREITSVLKRPRLRKYLSTDEALRFVADLAAQTILLTDPPGPPAAVCRDPNDDYLVALATARHGGRDRHRRSRPARNRHRATRHRDPHTTPARRPPGLTGLSFVSFVPRHPVPNPAGPP